jgi:hypothetical protein
MNPKYHVGRQQLRAKAADRRILAAIDAGEVAGRNFYASG